MKNKTYSILAAIVGAAVLTGCVNKGKPFQAIQPIPAGKGVLYVYNDPSHPGGCEVLVNDNAVGLLGGANYLVAQCKPGPLTVTTGWGTELNSATVDIKPGSRNFVCVDSRFPLGRAIVSLGLAPEKFYFTPKVLPEGDALPQIQKMGLAELGHGLADEFSAKVTPGINLSGLRKFYVADGEKSWQSPAFIASGLSRRGNVVRSGPASAVPADTQCLVMVREHWFWDLGSYLLKLEVDLVNPQSKAVMASAVIRRAMPQGRRGAKVMATEALNAIFNNCMPPGVERVH